jgi:type I restriction enzyme S subunit
VSGALDDLDVFVEALEQLIAKKRQIKQGAMQELLTGKKRLPGFSGEWIRVLLGELVSFAKGRGLPKTWLKDDGANPCIHYGELFTDYGPVIDQVLSRTDCMAGMVLSGRHDVLMPTSDVTPRGLAKASCVLQGGIVLGGDILIIRPGHRLYGPFLAHFIRCAEAEVLQLVSGTTVFHLYASDVRRLLVALPSVDEQVSIARALADLDAELAALETKLAKARALKQGISEALLTGRIRLMPPAPQAAAA